MLRRLNEFKDIKCLTQRKCSLSKRDPDAGKEEKRSEGRRQEEKEGRGKKGAEAPGGGSLWGLVVVS